MDTISFSAVESAKSVDLVDELRGRIKRGEWKAGQKLPSYSESRALFGAHSVAVEKAHAQLEREGLVVRQRGRGVFVAMTGAMQGTSSGKTRTGLIGVAGKGFSFKEYSPYWVSLLCGIRETCEAAETQIVLLPPHSNVGWEKADGVLICDWSKHYTLRWLPPEMPYVSLMVPVPGAVSVYADDYSGGYAATEHLLRLGHRKIAYLHARDNEVMPRRVAGWRDALRAAGIEAKASWERNMNSSKLDYGERFVENGRTAMQEWLESDWKDGGFSALLTHNDETANGVLWALQEAGVRVPEDVSVMGFDGAAPREHTTPALTTMRIPLEEIGAEAARLLLRQLNGEDVGAQHRVFSAQVRDGETTRQAKTEFSTAIF